jgi:hypothetical protein
VNVWQHISKWLGLSFFMTVRVQQHFLKFGDLVKGKINKRFRHLVWLATMWCLWRSRNNIIFRGDHVNISSLVDQIKYMSWFWFSGRVRNNVDVVFSDWCNNPLGCLQNT